MVTQQNLDLLFQVRILAGQFLKTFDCGEFLNLMTNFRAIILAAGRGTRMKSDLPKVLHKVAGKPLIEHVLQVVKSIGSLKTYVVVGYQSELIQRTLTQDVTFVRQEKLLGTADAVLQVLPLLRGFKGNILLLCGDTPLLQKQVIQSLIRRHTQTKAAATVLTAAVDDPTGYGRIIRDNNNRISAIREHRDASQEEQAISEINSGVYCFQAEVLLKTLGGIKVNRQKKEFYLTDIVSLLLQSGRRVETFKTSDQGVALGINTRQELVQAECILRQRILDHWMSQGVTITDPKTTYIEADVKIGNDTIIHPMTVIHSDVQIGRRCSIGPFARIRPGSRIADGAEIGNFTEVSRTKIGKNSLMKHFSFLGDAVLGESVNIGAGTVTANFDGKNKNKTTIGRNAFVGSDSILIAPVQVGAQAVVGAGSVVTKGTNIPSKALAVGVPARIIHNRNLKTPTTLNKK